MNVIDTPVGRLAVIASPLGVREVRYLAADEHPPSVEEAARAVAEQASRELAEFFAGERARFTVTLDTTLIGTAFARRVLLDATASIPAGQTRTYAQIAADAGRPAAVRAVGSALRRNPLPILIPCHRVIRTGGTLGRYAGADDSRKRTLLTADAQAASPLT